jgi:RND family efflux transporter MFP subunit
VAQRHVREGDLVKKGDVLLELTQNRTLMEFQQKKGALDDAEGAYDRAGREYNLQLKLFNADAASGIQLEDAQRAQSRALVARSLAIQEYQLAKRRLHSTRVRAPIDGIVLKDYTLNQSEIIAGKELVAVADTSSFTVRADVDELELQQLKLDQSVEIRVDAFPDTPMRGILKSIAAQAERDTFAKVPVRIDVVDTGGIPLKHNLSVRVNIVSEDIPDTMGIPLKAILSKDHESTWVYVRNRYNMVRKRAVRLGKVAGSEVQVTSGLEPGDRVGVPLPARSS